MLSAIAVVPSAPVLVPELSPGTVAELADLRAAAVHATSTLPDRWVAVGVGTVAEVVTPDSSGTFAGYGVHVPVALNPTSGALRWLPLCALITGWLRGQSNSRATAEVRVFADALPATAAVAAGRALRTEIDAVAEPVGVLVVADGATTLTPSAPGGHDPDAIPVQAALDDALAAADAAALAGLGERIVGRVAFGVLAGLIEPTPVSSHESYRGAPYGVGYFVGTMVP